MKQLNEIEQFSQLNGCYYITEDGKVLSDSKGVLKEVSQSKSKKGYMRCGCCDRKGKKSISVIVHRAVAFAFCDGYSEENNQVNHIDENKENNHFKNLEWCTSKYNKTYSAGTKLIMIVNNEEKYRFNSQAEVTEKTGIQGANISKIKTGERTFVGLWDINKNCKIVKKVGGNTDYKKLENQGIYRVYWEFV